MVSWPHQTKQKQIKTVEGKSYRCLHCFYQDLLGGGALVLDMPYTAPTHNFQLAYKRPYHAIKARHLQTIYPLRARLYCPNLEKNPV